jgi:hypothetical protein
MLTWRCTAPEPELRLSGRSAATATFPRFLASPRMQRASTLRLRRVRVTIADAARKKGDLPIMHTKWIGYLSSILDRHAEKSKHLRRPQLDQHFEARACAALARRSIEHAVMLCLITCTMTARSSNAATLCEDYRAFKSASESRFTALQVKQDGHNFWSSSKTLPGASDCRIYHSDEGDYHTVECNWRGMSSDAAAVMIQTLKADVSRCLEPMEMRERKPSARYVSNTMFTLSSSPAFDVDVYVRHSVSSDDTHQVRFEIGRSDAKGATDSGAGPAPAPEPSSVPTPGLDMAVLNLQVAAQKGDIPAITQALDAGVNIDAGGITHQTPLWSAAFNNQLPTALFLLKRGANVNVGDAKTSGIPLQGAILGGHFQIAKALLTETSMPTDAHGAGVATGMGPLLSQIVDTGDPGLLKTFIAHAANIDVNEVHPIMKWSALDSAIFSQKFGQAEILLRNLRGWHFAETEPTKENTLFNAVRSGSVEVTKAILDSVPNLDLSKKNFIGQTVLDAAADNPAMLKVLLSYHGKST